MCCQPPYKDSFDMSVIIDRVLEKSVEDSLQCLHFPCLHMEYNRKTFSDLIRRRECFRLIKFVLC